MYPTSTDRKRRVRNDILFIIALLLVVATAGVCLYLFRGEGDTVTVTVNGEVYGVYPLDMDRTEEIRTGEEGLNRLIIKDGKAYVESASCPDGICAAHRPIHRAGESIVCLPNRVVISVGNADEGDAPDAVV